MMSSTNSSSDNSFHSCEDLPSREPQLRSSSFTSTPSLSHSYASALQPEQPQQPSEEMVEVPLQQAQMRVSSLQDLKALDATRLQKEIRVLVTVHSTKRFNSDVYERGLGCWVAYIIQKYLKQRKIPHKFYMKSILTKESVASPFLATSPQTLIDFLKRNQIDYLIPSDVTDTMFVAEHFQEIAQACRPFLKMAVTPNVSMYHILEDKWATFNLCTTLDIPTPETGLFHHAKALDEHSYPIFLKAASGTNAGRGVWHCQNEDDLKQALASSEARRADLLLQQTPTYGEIICAQVIYRHGAPQGFFFAKSIQADDLAGMGSTYVFSQNKKNRDKSSHKKVELNETQWQQVTDIFERLGSYTQYHGMIDIEFIVAGPNNKQAKEGSLWLLECNPRFSGDIHTALSHPGFLDLYFEVMDDGFCDGEEEEGDFENVHTYTVTNYSAGVDMKSRFGDFKPTGFYTSHPFKILCLRHWGVSNFHTFPKQLPASSSPSTTTTQSSLSCWGEQDTDKKLPPSHNNNNTTNAAGGNVPPSANQGMVR